MRRRCLFTRQDVWLGSFYELAIELGPRSDDRLAAASEALWETESGIDWLDFYIPLGALETIYEVAYPYDKSWRVWAEPLDHWFADIGRSVHQEVPFQLGLIGEEVSGFTYASELATAGIPSDRKLLVPNDRGELDWYPATDWYQDPPRSFSR